MHTIHERHFYSNVPGGPIEPHIYTGVNEGVYYPGVNTCLTVTLVWTGAQDVIVGAHFGLMWGVTHATVNNMTDVAYVMGANTGVAQMRTNAAAALHVPIAALPAPDYALFLGDGVGDAGAYWEFSGVLPALRAWTITQGTAHNALDHEYDTAGNTCNIRVNRPSGWSLHFRGTWTVRNVVGGVIQPNRTRLHSYT